MSEEMPRVETYFNITEKQERLAGLYKGHGEKVLFVVPSGLDKDVLLGLISGRGSFFGPRPKIFTWSDIYRDLSQISLEGSRRIIDPPDHFLILSYILKKFLEEEDKKENKLPEGVYRSGFLDMLGSSIKELLNEDVSPGDLKARLFKEEEPPEGSPEGILLRLYTDYLEYLAGQGAADSAQTAALIRGCIEAGPAEETLSKITLVFIGFLTFTGSQLKLIKRFNEITNTIFFLPETGLDSPHDSVRQLGEEFRERAKWNSRVFELKAGDTQLQYDALAREAALWAHGEGVFASLGCFKNYGEIGLMVKPTGLSQVESALKRYRIPFNVQVRGTVAETLLGELPETVWRAFDSGWEREKTAFLLAGPLLRSSGFDLESSLSSFPEGSSSWRKHLKGPALEIFQKLEGICSDLEAGGTALQIMRMWHDFITDLKTEERIGGFIDDAPELDETLKDISSSIKELEMKIEMLEDISRDIGPASKIILKRWEAVSFISEWGRNATLPIRLPQSSSLTIYAGLPPVLTTHRYWVITDVDYNTWPGKLRESPLLDNENKARYNRGTKSEEKAEGSHIPELHEEREQKEALFRRLMATALQGTVVTRSLTDTNGRPLGPSQFFEPLFTGRDTDRKWEKAGSIEYKPSDAIPSGGAFWFSGAEIPLFAEQRDRGPFPREGHANEEKVPSVSLSSLDEWRECPYRYWCRHKIRLPEHFRKLFDPLKAGSLLHLLWERCWGLHAVSGKSFSILSKNEWKRVCSESYPELLLDPRLERHADELFKQAWAVADLLDRIESTDAIKRRRRTEIEYALQEYETGGVLFRGRADRVDFYDEGFVVIDYKSNRAGDHRNELQLAAYAAVIKKSTGARPLGYGWIGHKDASFYGCFDSEELSEAYFSPRSRKKLASGLEEAEKALEEMAKSVSEGYFPANYGSSMCRFCEYFVVCRRKEGYKGETEDEEGETHENDS